MYTYTNSHFSQTYLLQTFIFGVITHISPSDKKEMLKFKITTLNSEICDHVNNPKKEYRFNAFPTVYDAQKYIESVLTPEDKFMLHLEDGAIFSIDQWYIRDTESLDLLSRSAK